MGGLTSSQIFVTDRVDGVTDSYATWAYLKFSDIEVDIEFVTILALSKESLLTQTELGEIQRKLNEAISRYPRDSESFDAHVHAMLDQHDDLFTNDLVVWVKSCPRLPAESGSGFIASDLYWDESDEVSGCFYCGHHSGLDEAKLRISPVEPSRWLVRFHAIADHRNKEISFEGVVLETSAATDDDEIDVVAGFVYMLQAGKYFQIGRSNDVDPRTGQLAILVAEDTKLIHSIKTDDMVGIQAYWHQRFADKRLQGEWFLLSASDVRAFTREIGD